MEALIPIIMLGAITGYYILVKPRIKDPREQRRAANLIGGAVLLLLFIWVAATDEDFRRELLKEDVLYGLAAITFIVLVVYYWRLRRKK